MSNFELWGKACEANGTKLYCLEGEGDTALYKTQSWHLVKNNYFGDTPVYHVWVNGKSLVSTTNFSCAYAMWENHKGDEDE